MHRHRVFVSYSHRDRKHLDRLRVHLRPLERQGLIDLWSDTRLSAGDRWREELSKALATCKVAILLVSADFLASAFIVENELPPLMTAARSDGVAILPVIVSPCRFTRTGAISEFQAANDPDRSLSLLPVAEREKVWVRVTDAVEAALADRDPKEGWRFSLERKVLESLYELLNSPPDSFLIITAGDYYVQFWWDGVYLLSEAVSNMFLPKQLRLNRAQEKKLRGLGLLPPQGRLGNFSRMDEVIEPNALARDLAELTANIMADVYQVSRGTHLEAIIGQGKA